MHRPLLAFLGRRQGPQLIPHGLDPDGLFQNRHPPRRDFQQHYFEEVVSRRSDNSVVVDDAAPVLEVAGAEMGAKHLAKPSNFFSVEVH